MTIEFITDITPSRSAFKIEPATRVLVNPYSRVETVIATPGDRWKVHLSWTFLTKAETRELRAFLTSLRGQANRCYIKDTAHSNEGTWAGAPVTVGVAQYGNLLNCQGFTPGATMLRGDRFELNGRLHELIKDTTADGSGNATLTFEPEIITPPGDSEAINHAAPFGTFMLRSANSIPSFSQTKMGSRNVKVDFVESLRAI